MMPERCAAAFDLSNTPLQGPAQAQTVGLRHRQAIIEMREARIALARRLAIIMHAMLRDGTEFVVAAWAERPPRQETASSSRKERRLREGADDGPDFVARDQLTADCDFNLAALHPRSPHQAPTEREENACIPRRRNPGRASPLTIRERNRSGPAALASIDASGPCRRNGRSWRVPSVPGPYTDARLGVDLTRSLSRRRVAATCAELPLTTCCGKWSKSVRSLVSTRLSGLALTR